MFTLTIKIIMERVLPTAQSFGISFVSEVYVSSFLAIEHLRDRIWRVL